MSKFFENINKNDVQLDVLHGWDVIAKKWYIDIKMTGFSGSNIERIFLHLKKKLQKNS